MPNIQTTMNLVHATQAQNKKAWSRVFMMPNAHFMSLSNDKKGIHASICIDYSNQMACVEMKGRNKRGKEIVKKITVMAYGGVVNNTLTRLLSMIANDVSK